MWQIDAEYPRLSPTALCRTAVMKALPTDTEVEEAGRVDGGDFLLQLRLFAPGDYDEWSERWYD